MNDKRQELRQPLAERVELEIIAESAPGEVSTVISVCETLDISGGGLRIIMENSVAVGTIMNMVVTVDQGQRSFNLTAELRWIRPGDRSGQFIAGFEIYDTDFTDSAAWRYFVSRHK
jgi:hypothetical protein